MHITIFKDSPYKFYESFIFWWGIMTALYLAMLPILGKIAFIFGIFVPYGVVTLPQSLSFISPVQHIGAATSYRIIPFVLLVLFVILLFTFDRLSARMGIKNSKIILNLLFLFVFTVIVEIALFGAPLSLLSLPTIMTGGM